MIARQMALNNSALDTYGHAGYNAIHEFGGSTGIMMEARRERGKISPE
jgi:hypothetical protein